MWLLVAVLLVSGHHFKVHVEKFSTFEECNQRRQDVLEKLAENTLAIRVFCEVKI